ncbi:MAG TPA: hypothetical protein VHT53_05715, partial [Candidatus Elarobacter sp.]|nr:hypothetical protein [Candidatus Elarobacter sp.]
APAPAPAPPYGAQPIYVTQQVQMVQPYAIATPPKSMAASLLLTFFFGPLGMFYATVPGALIMLVISIVVGIATLGFGLLITGPICVIWAAVATSNYNQRIALAAGVAPTQVVR